MDWVFLVQVKAALRRVLKTLVGDGDGISFRFILCIDLRMCCGLLVYYQCSCYHLFLCMFHVQLPMCSSPSNSHPSDRLVAIGLIIEV